MIRRGRTQKEQELNMPMSADSTKAKRKMKLALFLTGDGNYHMAGWRLPGSTSDGGQNIQRWVEACLLYTSPSPRDS